jgi:CelD/BcsL family acetyltransferase involved in cellulose biosynthesis
MTLRTRRIDARQERDHLVAQWRALAKSQAREDLAASCDWFWDNLDWISPPEHRLCFVSVHDGERIVALFPVETRTIKLSGVEVRCGGFIGGPYAVADTAVVAGDGVERSARAFVSYLFDEMRGWGCFSTAGIDADSPAGSALIHALAARGAVMDRGSEMRPYVALDRGWSEYVESKSANFRRNVKRAVRRLSEQGELEYRSALRGSDGMEIVESVDHRSWRMAKERDVLANARLVAYCRNLYRTFPDPDAHVVRFLALNNEAIASLYGFIHAKIFYAIKVNYDISVSEGSPGFVLLTRVFEEMASRGIERIELLGKNEYLHRLGNGSHRMSRIIVFDRSARGRALGLAGRVAQRIHSIQVRATRPAGQE